MFLQTVFQVLFYLVRNAVVWGAGIGVVLVVSMLVLAVVAFPSSEFFDLLSPVWQSIYFSGALCFALLVPFCFFTGLYENYKKGKHLAVAKELCRLPYAVKLTHFVVGLIVVCVISCAVGEWRITDRGYTCLMFLSFGLGMLFEGVSGFVFGCAERKIFRDFVTSVNSSWSVKSGDTYADGALKLLRKYDSVTVLKGGEEIQVYPDSEGLLTEKNDFVGSDVFVVYAMRLISQVEKMVGKKGASLWYLPSVRNTPHSIEASFVVVSSVDGGEMYYGYEKGNCSRIFNKPELSGFIEFKSA